MQQGPPRRRRARPVADAPIDALLLRAGDLAKGWLLALLEQAPLDDAPAILAADLARDGPRMCEAVVRALASEDDLHRLEPGGALEPLISETGELAGARGAEATSRAVDALGAVIWAGLRSELADPDPDQIAELVERLAVIIELVRAAALRAAAAERVGAGPARAAPAGREEPARRGAPAGERRAVRRVPEAVEPRAAPDALWKDALDDEIRRASRSGGNLSLILAELEDADRMSSVEPPREASAMFGRFAQAVRSVVRRQDILACESESRAWVIARDTGRLGAQALGARIVRAVASAEPWRGAPMTVQVGLAVLGEDGRHCDALIDAAEEASFAAAASGAGMADEPFEGPEPPPGSGPELAG